MLSLANGAVSFASALLFRLVTDGADDGTLHGGASLKTVPDRRLRRQGGRTEPFAKELQVRFVSVVAPFGRFAIKLCLNAAF
jgi:hypothetical protein